MSRTVLAGGRVFDGTGAPVRDADVVVEAGRIVAVGPGLDGDEAVDMAGRCLLPGLFDCHTHVTLGDVDLLGHLQRPFSYRFFQTVRDLAATLAAGITTVRDAAGADTGVKRAVADGLVPGPRLQISITLLSQTGGHGDGWFASGQEVRFWPVYPGMPDGLVAEAAAAGRWVMAHAQGADGVKVAMGTDSGVTPHGRNLAELELMAKSGMEPAAVLHATTASAAALMGLEAELGTLEPGKRADLVAVDGDPFELATLPDRVAAVWQDGRLVAGRA